MEIGTVIVVWREDILIIHLIAKFSRINVKFSVTFGYTMPTI